MPPAPQPMAPNAANEGALSAQSFLLDIINTANAPMAPAQDAPHSCPKWPRIAQPRPNTIATKRRLVFFAISENFILQAIHHLQWLLAQSWMDQPQHA